MVITPPALLMEDCPETPVVIQINADMAKKIRQLKVDLAVCNIDKQGLRDWSAKVGTK